jgi:FkbM family methyltransferase
MADNDLIDAIIRRSVKKDSNCMDVGAHHGRFLRTILRHAPRGRHIAIEPIPHMAEDLRSRFPAVELHDLALSDHSGKTTFHFLPDSPGSSSIKYRTERYAGKTVRTLEVALATLDEVVAGRDIALIKVDVEGAQYQVFAGAMRTLERCKPVVVFEHGSMAERDYGTTSDMLFDLFADCGMGLQGLEGFMRGRGPMSRRQFEEAVASPQRYNYVAFGSA